MKYIVTNFEGAVNLLKQGYTVSLFKEDHLLKIGEVEGVDILDVHDLYKCIKEQSLEKEEEYYDINLDD